MEWIQKNHIVLKKTGIIAGVYLGMKYLVPLLIPFFVAGLLVCWCWPLLRWLQRRLHIRPSYAMAFFLILAAGGLAAAAVWLGKGLGRLTRWLSQLFGNPVQTRSLLYECCDEISRALHLQEDQVRVFVTEQINVFRDYASQEILPGAFGGSVEILKSTGAWAAALLVTGIALLLIASDFEKIKEAGQSWPFYRRLVPVIREILRSVGGYLKAQAIIMGLVMVLCTGGIWIAKVTGAPVVTGIAMGLLDALPVFGTGTVFLPWILILVLQKEFQKAVILAVTYGVCVLARELLEPRLIGARLGVLPVVILASVYAGVKAYGFGGILLGPLSVLLIRELWRQVDASAAADLGESARL